MIFERVQCRYMTALMMFLASCACFMMRTNLNVNIVAMVPASNNTNIANQTTLQWTPYQRANVLSSHFWGDILACLIGGPIAERCGARYVVLTGILVSALLTMVTPVAAKHSYISMFTVRLLLGLFTGFVTPGSHVLVSRWAVITDKGKFCAALLGGSIGVFIAWSVCGQLIELFGWEWGFYCFGIISFLIVVFLWFLLYDSPEKHPYITIEEKQYLTNNIHIRKVKQSIPYRHILTSVPFWSLATILFGSGWGIYFVITAAPIYIANALRFNIASAGVLSALTYLAKSICSFLFGWGGDLLLKKNIVSLNTLRKSAIFLSHIIPGVGLLAMAYPGMPQIYYIALIIVVMAMNGAVTLTTAANGHDLTRNFAGTVNGIAFAMMTVAGVITPYVTAFFTKDDETNAALWQPVFYTGGTVLIATGLQFLFLGSTKTQFWNDIQTEKDLEEQEKR